MKLRKSSALLNSIKRTEFATFEQLLNVGPAIAADFRCVGLHHPRDLIGLDPYALYDLLCRTTGTRHDPCVIDVFISAVRFMDGGEAKPWWVFTAERKKQLRAQKV